MKREARGCSCVPTTILVALPVSHTAVWTESGKSLVLLWEIH